MLWHGQAPLAAEQGIYIGGETLQSIKLLSAIPRSTSERTLLGAGGKQI